MPADLPGFEAAYSGFRFAVASADHQAGQLSFVQKKT